MTALNTFIEANVPKDVTQVRDYAGARGWVALCNQILRRLENEGLIRLTQLKEVGIEVADGYWINIPSDYRGNLEIYMPGYEDYNMEKGLPFSIVNNRIKLEDSFSKDEAPDTFTLSSGGLTSIKINDTDAAANEWEGYLLALTNGTYSGDSIIIGEHSAASAGLTTLNFLHSRSTSIVTSTTGYLTEMYLMMRYMAQLTPVTAYNSTLPVDDRFNNVLINGFCYLSKPVTSDERKAYRVEFENDIELLRDEIFTPTPDQARPINRSMAALEECSGFSGNHNEFVGDQNAWLE
jgi:hypothetical protein